ncbi:MAG TPA: hypothetical protein VK558_14095 [Patescibacteria group bacterium]|nr:hypothetical protein [Patescibacteria group bacterium]
MSGVWGEFAELHSSAAFFAQVVELFRDHWPQALLQHLGGSLLGHSMGLFQRDRFPQGLNAPHGVGIHCGFNKRKINRVATLA